MLITANENGDIHITITDFPATILPVSKTDAGLSQAEFSPRGQRVPEIVLIAPDPI